MTIHILKEEYKTVVICDKCSYVEETSEPNGVVPQGWLTGQLWLDVSLASQKQTPICFCPSCGPAILSAVRVLLSPVVVEPEPEGETPTEPEPEALPPDPEGE